MTISLPSCMLWPMPSIKLLGNIGKTVIYTDPVDANPVNQTESIKDLVADMRAGKVDMLFIMGGNPAYDAPADLGFADALKNTNIPMRVHLGLYQDETAELCQWHVNEAHYLESWGDTRAYDGTVSIVQPLIAPLYGGKSVYEITALLAGQAEATGHEVVQGYWQEAASRRGLRLLLAKVAARRMDRRNDVCAQADSVTGDLHSSPAPPPSARELGTLIPLVDRNASRSTSAAIPAFMTAASPITAGCRSCPNRCPR